MIPDDFRIMNAAGECKRTDDVRTLADAALTDITVGVMAEGRPGNPGETFWIRDDDAYALNSRGLPSPPAAYYRAELPAMRAIARNGGKKLRANISACSPEGYAESAAIAAPFADEIEINCGCPNVWGDHGQKPIASFDRELLLAIIARVMDASLKACARRIDDIVFSVKLSPYSNPAELAAVAKALAGSGIDSVVTSNTFPNGMTSRADGSSLISTGLAGVSGRSLLPIALGQVAQFRQLLPPGISVIGAGGIRDAEDARQFIAAGASGIQVGTYLFKYGPGIFSDIMLAL